MPLSSALFSSVSGLDTTSTAISVIGDNIANVNTPGFKERRVEFSDVLGQTISNVVGFSNFGAGAKVSRTTTLFTQGTFENTGRPTDLAIEGRGFFVLAGQQGNVYSRAGVFTIDSQGMVVNPDGLRLQGQPLDPVTGAPLGQIQDIQVSAAQACYYRTVGGLELCADLFDKESDDHGRCARLVAERNPGC